MSTFETPQEIQNLVRTYMRATNRPALPPTFSSNSLLMARKGDLRYIENDPLFRREKFDGSRWRLVCTWTAVTCTNFVYSRNLCVRHNAESQNKPLRKKKKIVHIDENPQPTTSEVDRGPLFLYSPISPVSHLHKPSTVSNDDDEIQIIAEVYPNESIDGPRNSTLKQEHSHYAQFSIDSPDLPYEKPTRTSHHSVPKPTGDVEFIGLKTNLPSLNVVNSFNNKMPPLTEFEEEYIGTTMIQNLPLTCSMLDAQLFLHDAAMKLVQKNYRLKMEQIAPEYFYDFLLRHPCVSLHYKHWFTRCKPFIPTTGCPIDMKIWTISMMILGMTSVHQTDEAT